MTQKERLKRPAPARDRPKRAFHPALDDVRPTVSRGTTPDGPNAPLDADEIIVSAVTAAYRVAAENVEEGRRAAERLRATAAPTSPFAAPPEGPESAKAIAGRLGHIARDLGVTWIELITAVLRDPDLRGVFDRLLSTDRRPGPEAKAAPPAGGSPIVQRVRSRKPIEITLSPLALTAEDGAPAIAGLHSLEPGAPSIGTVRFLARDGGAHDLSIDIPDDQPAGDYFGTVVGRDSRRPVGTLTVVVLE